MSGIVCRYARDGLRPSYFTFSGRIADRFSCSLLGNHLEKTSLAWRITAYAMRILIVVPSLVLCASFDFCYNVVHILSGTIKCLSLYASYRMRGKQIPYTDPSHRVLRDLADLPSLIFLPVTVTVYALFNQILPITVRQSGYEYYSSGISNFPVPQEKTYTPRQLLLRAFKACSFDDLRSIIPILWKQLSQEDQKVVREAFAKFLSQEEIGHADPIATPRYPISEISGNGLLSLAVTLRVPLSRALKRAALDIGLSQGIPLLELTRYLEIGVNHTFDAVRYLEARSFTEAVLLSSQINAMFDLVAAGEEVNYINCRLFTFLWDEFISSRHFPVLCVLELTHNKDLSKKLYHSLPPALSPTHYRQTTTDPHSFYPSSKSFEQPIGPEVDRMINRIKRTYKDLLDQRFSQASQRSFTDLIVEYLLNDISPSEYSYRLVSQLSLPPESSIIPYQP